MLSFYYLAYYYKMHKPGHLAQIQKAQRAINKAVRPIVRKTGKGITGASKLTTAAGYKGVGRKMGNVGRAVTAASRVKDLRTARTAINKALKAQGKK